VRPQSNFNLCFAQTLCPPPPRVKIFGLLLDLMDEAGKPEDYPV